MSSLNKTISFILPLLLPWCHAVEANGENSAADEYLTWQTSIAATVGNGDFAPYYIGSLTHGTINRAKGVYAAGLLKHDFDKARRFSWCAGLQVNIGYANAAEYLKWNTEGVSRWHNMRPPLVWLQQVYAGVKYRSLMLEFGLKEYSSFLLDNTLSSGDWVESGNARPIPQVRAGFVDFIDIPLTKGMLQIQGTVAVGKFTDNGWLKRFYSYGTSHINTGAYFLYRRLFFRTDPSRNFSATFGMQAAGQTGGETFWYNRGVLIRSEKFKSGIWDVLKAIIPNGERNGVGKYYGGNNLGTWDLHFRYRIPGNKGQLKLYLQKPWEKGSSVGWANGFDGLWGTQYIFGNKFKIVESILFEYITLLNQSGPIHFAPHDYPGTTIVSDVSGRDNYYNNNDYNAYANYGIGIGSPFLKAPAYNRDGYLQYTDNLGKGFHMAAKGHAGSLFKWKVAAGYRKAYGTGAAPRKNVLSDFSWLIQIEKHVVGRHMLDLKLQIAGDHGSLLGNNFGVAISAVYHGKLSISK